MSLTKKQRESMSPDDFAVPEKKDLPIHDKVHVGMAWKMVDQTKGLSDAQRKSARERILKRANELGMDTSDWDTSLKADDDESNDKIEREMEIEQEKNEMRQEAQRFSFSALAMEIPDSTINHPNKTPFKGVLTKLDEPSDNPLSGSNGKCVILPKMVAEKALPSLLGMAIDFTANLDGHDAKQKIGLITEANIVGNEIQIAGFFYSADFPSEVKRIQAEKSQLGFSYEAQAIIRSMNDDPLVMKDCVFTGAAVLYKDMAAYTTTSLAANKQTENDQMNDEIKKMFEAFQAKLEGIETKLNAQADIKKVEAASVQHLVKPHADAMRTVAAGMQAAGIGMHPKMGHVATLNGMADHLEAAAAMGQLPHIYQAPDFYNASKEMKEIKAEASAEVKAMADKLDEINSKLIDIEKSKFAAAASPERKTLDPAISKLLAKNGIKATENEKLDVIDIDKHLKSSNLTVAQRMQAKLSLQEAGQL